MKKNDIWAKGNETAKKKYGMTLDKLVEKRKGLKKNSDEYAVIQNAINDSLGSNKIHKTSSIKNETIAHSKMGLKTKKADVGKQFLDSNERNVDNNLDRITARMNASLKIRKDANSAIKELTDPVGVLLSKATKPPAKKTKHSKTMMGGAY